MKGGRRAQCYFASASRSANKNSAAVDISNLFIGGSSIVFVPQLLWLPRCFRQHAEMVKESLRCSYALRATTPCAGKAAVREKACGPPRYGSTAGGHRQKSIALILPAACPLPFWRPQITRSRVGGRRRNRKTGGWAGIKQDWRGHGQLAGVVGGGLRK